jgi:hypothetical protein
LVPFYQLQQSIWLPMHGEEQCPRRRRLHQAEDKLHSWAQALCHLAPTNPPRLRALTLHGDAHRLRHTETHAHTLRSSSPAGTLKVMRVDGVTGLLPTSASCLLLIHLHPWLHQVPCLVISLQPEE